MTDEDYEVDMVSLKPELFGMEQHHIKEEMTMMFDTEPQQLLPESASADSSSETSNSSTSSNTLAPPSSSSPKKIKPRKKITKRKINTTAIASGQTTEEKESIEKSRFASLLTMTLKQFVHYVTKHQLLSKRDAMTTNETINKGIVTPADEDFEGDEDDEKPEVTAKERRELLTIRRMISNREYAQKSRDRKKAELQELRTQNATLQEENLMLRSHLEYYQEMFLKKKQQQQIKQ